MKRKKKQEENSRKHKWKKSNINKMTLEGKKKLKSLQNKTTLIHHMATPSGIWAAEVATKAKAVRQDGH